MTTKIKFIFTRMIYVKTRKTKNIFEKTGYRSHAKLKAATWARLLVIMYDKRNVQRIKKSLKTQRFWVLNETFKSQNNFSFGKLKTGKFQNNTE